MPSLTELGERQIIRIFERSLGPSRRMIVGFGDDVSVVRFTNRRVAVLKTDMLVASTDVPPGMTMNQLARKAVVANVSDLAAKGIQPYAGLVALGLPAKLTEDDAVGIANGISQTAREYGFPFVGGDTSQSRDLIIAIALFAIASKRRLMLRSGAKVGDIVAVSGDFGSTAAGLKAVLRHRLNPKTLPPALYQAVYRPRAELSLGMRLAGTGAITSSIDSSDGLASGLHDLSKLSGVGIHLNHIPISRDALRFASKHHYNPDDLALFGGEEYHLILTVKPRKFKLAQTAAKGKLKQIGVVTRRPTGLYLSKAGKNLKIPMKGWEHFKSRM